MGMHPRWLKPNSLYAQTQRTVDRQFLFKPDPVIRNIIGASAARAQQNHPVKIYWLEFNINHEQNGIAALSGNQIDLDNLINFKRTFHRLIACEINAYLGREGAVFSTPSRHVECIDDESAEQQFFYAMTNPVKDGLVERVAQWKGFSSYNVLALGQDEVFTYYDRTAWHRSGGKKSPKSLEAFAKTIRIAYTPLPRWESMKPDKREAMIRRECRALEQRYLEERKREGRAAMTAERMEELEHRDRPKTRPERSRKPLCHASSAAAAAEYKEAYFAFLESYWQASGYYRSGVHDVEFPPGSIRPPLMTVRV